MRLVHDTSTNTLRLQLDRTNEQTVERTERIPGLIDVADGGRLVGIELTPGSGLVDSDWLFAWSGDPVAREWLTIESDGAAYFQLTTGDDQHARSSPIELTVDLDASGSVLSISIPRRGAGYELSYPSGNQ